MLKPILKGAAVNESERLLSELVESTFLSLWSYPSPHNDEGITKNKSGKEICDLLVVFGNRIIIFSDKDIKFNADKDLMVAWDRWYRRSITDSVRQLYAAEAWIKSYPNRVYLDKFCKEKFPIDLSRRYEFHLIAVTRNSYEPAKRYFDSIKEGSSGTLMLQYRQVESMPKRPFLVGDVDKSKTFVHVLDEYSVRLLLNELGTIKDFSSYLVEKEKKIRSGYLAMAAGEEEILACYLASGGGGVQKERLNLGGASKDEPACLIEGLWAEFKKSYMHAVIKTQRDNSALWGKLIKDLSDGVISAQVGEGKDQSFSSHEIAIRELASEDRFSRFILNDAFVEKLKYVPSAARSARLIQSPRYPRKYYVFLLYPRKGKEYSRYREERAHLAGVYSIVIKYRMPNAEKIVVIATEPKDAEGRSESVFVFDVSRRQTHKDEKIAKKLMKEYSIFNELVEYGEGRHEDEYKSKREPKTGRNDPCDCGSGKKYKKCCGFD